MRSFDTATATYLESAEGIVARLLIRIEARNRTTGAAEVMGLFTGADPEREFTAGGETRTWYGAGNVIEMSPITMQSGLEVRMRRLLLSHLTPEVAQLIRGYSARFAPVTVYRGFFDALNGTLIAEPHRVFKGFVDEIAIRTPEAGGTAEAELTMATTARLLTGTLPLKKSDASQSLRSGDRFRRYADVSGSVPVWWGERRSTK